MCLTQPRFAKKPSPKMGQKPFPKRSVVDYFPMIADINIHIDKTERVKQHITDKG
ncbi:hypothetical protein HMPREF1705_04700 [Acetomicrobium hydrogeniformans ATCC BAA-1850]|uniref:Uncharacterized protein n=1 Tax=Acetomicrobium hydrogeniformans ATCC BAA-1850 TaxID=592015 RepID=A0A0T5XCL3_9BACT|nr:hypothetical protein HMPREF1705_04700 [Acetomicrobium hydrogeniformans ATCC BAA-1850]